MPSFVNHHAPYAFDKAIELTLLRSILSRPIVLKRRVELAAFPNISLKISKRPGLLDTTGSVTVLYELERLRGTIKLLFGIVMGWAIFYLFMKLLSVKRDTQFRVERFYRDDLREDCLVTPISTQDILQFVVFH